ASAVWRRRHETVPVAPPRPLFRGLRLGGPCRGGRILAGGALPLGAPAGPGAVRRPPEGSRRDGRARGARGGGHGLVRCGPLPHAL
ncbi:MAG: hypothetical protein AVDCRST_MAG02-2145, partial [uncultured Rubrobacteraceae bacterium]